MIHIIVAGDFCPVGRVDDLIRGGDASGVADIVGSLVPIMRDSDYVVLNLECPLTYASTAISKSGPNLKASPEAVCLLKQLGVDLVTLANNHIYDYGHAGLNDTIRICRGNGIATIGAGDDLRSAQTCHFAAIDGRCVAFINFAEHEFGIATHERGGANGLDVIGVTRQIRMARQQADAVVVIAHGGHENFHYPSPRIVELYRFLTDQGASAVVGHHSHCIAGYEIHCGAPIFYSLGNLLFWRETDFSGWYQGYMVRLDIDRSHNCRFSIIPYTQCLDAARVCLLSGSEAADFTKTLSDISEVLLDSKEVGVIWEEFASYRSSSVVSSVLPVPRRLSMLLWRLGIIRYLVPRSYWLRLLNLVRCESHRDVLLYAIDNLSRGGCYRK